jgi:uncharacterized protein YdaU (DUF1376 family)
MNAPVENETATRPKLSYQKLFWFDFFAGTRDLNGFEKGVYLILIGNYFMNQGPLPDDDNRLASMTSLSLEQWHTLRPALERRFDVSNGSWRHYIMDRDLAEAEAERDAKSKGGRITQAKLHAKLTAQLQDSSSPLQPDALDTAESIPEHARDAAPPADEEELLRRTRELVGPDEMQPPKLYFWRALLRDHPAPYRDALADAERRKQEALLGLAEAQIRKSWAHYLAHTLKQMKQAHGL